MFSNGVDVKFECGASEEVHFALNFVGVTQFAYRGVILVFSHDFRCLQTSCPVASRNWAVSQPLFVSGYFLNSLISFTI